MAPVKSSLVVIGGWLGCKPKHLKAYESLYGSLGLHTLSFIPSPLCVIDSTLTQQNSHFAIPSSKQCVGNLTRKKITNMTALAWKVLGDIYDSKAEIFIYHSFSNGGCFLWESMCQILLLKDCQLDNTEIYTKLKVLRGKCKGVIFDSCPAWFGTVQEPSKLWLALQHCSDEEKEAVRSIYGDRIHGVDKDMVNRNLEYFENLAVSPIDIPQLYLFSKNDVLSKQEYISKMIDVRRSRQKCLVSKKVWDHSVHCSHLREHGEDYKNSVTEFIQQLNGFPEARL